jgi:beta-galactosidase
MTYHKTLAWNEDVFAYNDYTRDPQTGDAALRPPMPGLPYLITEAVGVTEPRPHHYAWTDPPFVLAMQAALHAQSQGLARKEAGYAGMLGWAGFDYASPEGLDPESVKFAGVVDGFRVLKPGSAIYQAQVNPSVRPVIAPVFFWDPDGIFPIPAPAVMIASNCDRLEIFIGSTHAATGRPETQESPYNGLVHPPFMVNLPRGMPQGQPDLLIEGYVGSQQLTELRMAANPAGDRLALTVDDAAIAADGSDATRALFRAVDKYGNLRRTRTGAVTLTVGGPATLIGDNPFAFGDYGGLGAVWIRSVTGQAGTISLAASHPQLGRAEVTVQAVRAGGQLV